MNSWIPYGLACILLAACGGGGTEPDVEPLTVEVDGFTLTCRGPVTRAQAQTILNALEENALRIREHLRVQEMPHILIQVWHPDGTDDWYSTMSSSLGEVYPGATGYLWGPGEMRLLLNSQTSTEVVHEYAHLVSMQVNSTLPNNPRWLWEAVAMYEAGQLYDPSAWTEAERRFPGFPALNSYNSPVPYLWGYLISEAVINRWGDDGFLEIIRLNGNIGGALGVTETEFVATVQDHVDSYL